MKNLFVKQIQLLIALACIAHVTVAQSPIRGTSSAQDAGGTAGVLGTSTIYNGVLGFTTATGHAGVAGACDEGMGNGVYGRSKNKNGIEGWSYARQHSGVVGTNEGAGNGVLGVSNGKQANGVCGVNNSGGTGTAGVSNSGIGVLGVSESSEGMHAETKSTQTAALAAYQMNAGSSSAAIFAKHNGGGVAGLFDGSVRVSGNTVTKTLEILGGSDIAEHFKTATKNTIEAGTLMILDEENQGEVVVSHVAYDKKVVGVVSGAGGVKSGMTLRQEGILEGDAVIAVAGRVYVKASVINGAIKPGDLLTSYTLQGYAMKATNKRKSNGAIIGKALTSLPTKEGLVLMLVNLQ